MRRWLLNVMLTGTVGFGLLIAVALVVGSLLPAGEQLLYIIEETNRYELLDLQRGVNLPFVVLRAGVDYDPRWSPDGQRLAFITPRFQPDDNWRSPLNVGVIAANGRNLRQLTTSSSYRGPVFWSPDGDKLAYVAESVENGLTDVRVLDLETGQDIQVSPPQNTLENPYWWQRQYLAWTTDGRYVYAWAMQAQTLRTYRLDTDNPGTLEVIAERFVVVSPMGTPVYAEGDGEIYQLLDDGSRANLTHSAVVETMPAWSPDGKWLSFAQGGLRGQMNIVLLNSDDNSIRQISDGGVNTSPFWSADGQYVLYWHRNFSDTVISLCVADTNGNTLGCIPNLAYADLRPMPR